MDKVQSKVAELLKIEYDPAIHATFTDLMDPKIRKGAAKLYKKSQVSKHQQNEGELSGSRISGGGRSTMALQVGQIIDQITTEYIKHFLNCQSVQTAYLRRFFPFLTSISTILGVIGIPPEEELQDVGIKFVFEKQIPSIGPESSTSGKMPFSRVDAMFAYVQEPDLRLFLFEFKVSTLQKDLMFQEYAHVISYEQDNVAVASVSPENVTLLGNITFAFVQMSLLMKSLLEIQSISHAVNLIITPIVILLGDSWTIVFIPEDPIETMESATCFSGIMD